jgi:hypothetical protein
LVADDDEEERGKSDMGCPLITCRIASFKVEIGFVLVS